MTTTTDRDSALAALIATLDPVAFPHDDYVSALDDAGGDVSRAAEMLLMGTRPKSKRKLEHFFKPKSKPKREWLPRSGPAPEPEPSSPKTDVDRAASAQQWSSLLKPSAGELRAPDRGTIHLPPSAVPTSGLPITLLSSPLTPRAAAALFHELMAESPAWPRNKWFLAGREVESNHQATSYALPGGGFGAGVGVPYYYVAKGYEAKPYTPLLAEAAKMVEDAVNAHLDSVPRYAWEWRGRWRANMCAANRYDGAQATVGFHSDQMTYLGPYPTIASLSLGTPRAFRLRAVETPDENAPKPRTYEVTLGHNSLVLMTPGCQERFKHTVPPQRALDTFRPGWDENGDAVPAGEGRAYTSRINITFRFYRDDFHPSPGTGPYGPRSGTPICKCGIPTLLRADQKAKARARMGPVSNGGRTTKDGTQVLEDDMVFFWQCQSPGATGEMKGCGFFKILDMRGEGRGPCMGYDEGDEAREVGADATGRTVETREESSIGASSADSERAQAL